MLENLSFDAIIDTESDRRVAKAEEATTAALKLINTEYDKKKRAHRQLKEQKKMIRHAAQGKNAGILK